MDLLEQWLYWTQVACIVMSAVLAGLMGYRYALKRSAPLLLWAVAWCIITIRVASGLLLSYSLVRDFVNDFLTINHDLLLFLRLAVLLEMGNTGKVYFPVLYLTMHSIISALLYFGLGSRLFGAIETVLFAHPYFSLCCSGISMCALGLRSILARKLSVWPSYFGRLTT